MEGQKDKQIDIFIDGDKDRFIDGYKDRLIEGKIRNQLQPKFLYLCSLCAYCKVHKEEVFLQRKNTLNKVVLNS